MKTRLKLSLVSIMILTGFLTITGCVGEDDSLGEPEDVFMEITDVETRETDWEEDPSEKDDWEFLVLEVEMTNDREQNIEVNTAYFDLQESSPDGRIYDVKDGRGVPFIIQPEETAEFELIFEIHQDDVADILWFDPPYEEDALSWAQVPT